LQVPKTTLQFHGFRRLPFNVYAHWPMNLEQLFTLAMAWKDYRLATTVHFAFGVFTLLAMHAFCRRQSRPAAGPLAAVIFLMNGVVLLEVPIAYIDIGGAFFFFMAFWFVAERLQHPENGPRPLLLAGAFIGLMAGTKFNGFLGGVCLGLLFLIASRREGKPLRRLREMLLYMGLPGFLLLLPWLIKNALETGNPVYPFLYSSLGGSEWNQHLSNLFYQWHHDAIGMGRTWRDYLLLPWRLLVEAGPGLSRFGGTLNILWFALLPLAWFGRRLPPVRWCLLVSLFYFVSWCQSSQQTRFLIPILPFLSVAAALSLQEAIARLPWLSWRRPLAVALAIAAGAWLLYSAAAQPAAIGLTEGKYGERLQRDPREKAIRCLNEKLPRKARVMVLQHNRCFFIDRKCIADSFYAASQINEFVTRPGSFKDMKKRLRKMGVTHLLKGQRAWKLEYPRDFEKKLADPAEARLVCRDRKYQLYELKNTP
jgi:4-amino-4-deoxy-L-arabinose transferase-like glycosyltransferase